VILERTSSLVVAGSPHLPLLTDMYTEVMRPEGVLLPSWWDLPDRDDSMENAYDHAQSALLKETARPALDRRHPDGRYCLAHDTAIYFRTVESRRSTAVVPDWCYVPGLTFLVEGRPRPSFVMWRELVAPGIVIEYVSEQDGGEWDDTPEAGKFWVYEHVIRPAFYAIYDVRDGTFEVYRLGAGGVGLELGVWTGPYEGTTLPWLRWYNADGTPVPTGAEQADRERQRADEEHRRAEKLAAKLRELGVNPDQL